MKGRRLPVVDGRVTMPTEPGDYCGPVTGYTGQKPAVLYLLPDARDDAAAAWERGIGHVSSPPHVFTENDDGTLTITESIQSVGMVDGVQVKGWHGYLTAGEWREA